MASANHQGTGTRLPRYHYFEPSVPFGKLAPFCDRYGIKAEAIRAVVVEPAVRSGEVVSVNGDAPLFTYACGTNPDTITRMAEAILAQSGISGESMLPAQVQAARQELWGILNEFAMGYGRPAEERIGLVTKTLLHEKFNLRAVNALATVRLWRDLTDAIGAVMPVPPFGDIVNAYIDIWSEQSASGELSAVFGLFVQGRITSTRQDGSILCVNPTHCRTLRSPPLEDGLPVIATTTPARDGSISIFDILPEGDAGAKIKADYLLWRRGNALVIADVTGSF